jgi:hypothetical protein
MGILWVCEKGELIGSGLFHSRDTCDFQVPVAMKFTPESRREIS